VVVVITVGCFQASSYMPRCKYCHLLRQSTCCIIDLVNDMSREVAYVLNISLAVLQLFSCWLHMKISMLIRRRREYCAKNRITWRDVTGRCCKLFV